MTGCDGKQFFKHAFKLRLTILHSFRPVIYFHITTILTKNYRYCQNIHVGTFHASQISKKARPRATSFYEHSNCTRPGLLNWL